MVTDAYDLLSTDYGSSIHEDVMNQIFDISEIPLPFTQRVMSGSHSNPIAEWIVDRLQAPVDNAVLDSFEGGTDDSYRAPERRIRNHSQISTKDLHVSSRANASDTIGYARELAQQVMRRGNELRRDVERACLLNNASVQDTGAGGNAGEAAGLEAWLDDEDERNTTIYNATAGNPTSYRDLSTGGVAIGGWTNHSSGIVPAVDYTSVTAVGALTETSVKDVVEQLYTNGADPTVLMARPSVIRRLSEYMFTSSARVATLTNQDSAASRAQRVAQGSVNVMVTDFSVLELVPNRLQPASGGTGTPPESDTVFIFDPSMIQISYLRGYRTEPLAKTGLQEKMLISVDWTLKPLNWTCLGGILGVDKSAAVTA